MVTCAKTREVRGRRNGWIETDRLGARLGWKDCAAEDGEQEPQH